MNRRILFDRFLLFACFFPLYLAFSGSSFLWDFDETYFASAGMLMHERGDWIVPVVNTLPDGTPILGDKPILMFWTMLVSFSLFGVNEMAARLPSVIYGVLTLQLVYTLIRHLFDRRTALLGGFILGSMFMFCVESSSLTTDAALLFWKVAALTLYVTGLQASGFGFQESESNANSEIRSSKSEAFFPQSRLRCLLIYVCLGFAFLTKGPVGVVLPMTVIGMFMLIKRRRFAHFSRQQLPALCFKLPLFFLKTVWAMRPLTAVIVMTLIAAPWYMAVHRATDGAWTALFFGVHNFGRALAPMEGHGYPLDFLWYYPFFLLIITLPWSIFFGPTLLDTVNRLRQGAPQSDACVFAVCWVCVYVVLFSIVRTKMPNYVYFATPGMAMLFAAFLSHWAEYRTPVSLRWMDAAMVVLFVLGAGLLILLPLALLPLFVPVPLGHLLYIIPGIILFASVRLAWILHRCSRAAFTSGMTLAAIAMAFSVFCLGAGVVTRQQDYAAMFEEAKRECDNPVFCAFNCCEPSWVFYGKQPLPRFNDQTDDSLAGLGALERFLNEHRNNAYMITSRECYEQILRPVYGNRLRVVTAIPYFLKLAKAGHEDTNVRFGHRSRELVLLGGNKTQRSGSY